MRNIKIGHVGLLTLTLVSTAVLLAHDAATPRRPVLLELFTSEGCSSCPPADALLRTLDANQPVSGAELIVLSEHVDYWNHDGWTDPYSSKAFSERQQQYAEVLGSDDVYTPQLVIDGADQVVGSRAAAVKTAIGNALKKEKVDVSISGAARQGGEVTAHVQAAPLPAGVRSATVYAALADNEDRSQVARGENAGRALTHVAVVRSLSKVGSLDGNGFSKDLRIAVRSAAPGTMRLVIFIQDGSKHRVLGAAQVKI